MAEELVQLFFGNLLSSNAIASSLDLNFKQPFCLAILGITLQEVYLGSVGKFWDGFIGFCHHQNR
jgi:hypothetical protein